MIYGLLLFTGLVEKRFAIDLDTGKQQLSVIASKWQAEYSIGGPTQSDNRLCVMVWESVRTRCTGGDFGRDGN